MYALITSKLNVYLLGSNWRVKIMVRSTVTASDHFLWLGSLTGKRWRQYSRITRCMTRQEWKVYSNGVLIISNLLLCEFALFYGLEFHLLWMRNGLFCLYFLKNTSHWKMLQILASILLSVWWTVCLWKLKVFLKLHAKERLCIAPIRLNFWCRHTYIKFCRNLLNSFGDETCSWAVIYEQTRHLAQKKKKPHVDLGTCTPIGVHRVSEDVLCIPRLPWCPFMVDIPPLLILSINIANIRLQ